MKGGKLKKGEEEKELVGHKRRCSHGSTRTKSPISTGSVWLLATHITAQIGYNSSLYRAGVEQTPVLLCLPIVIPLQDNGPKSFLRFSTDGILSQWPLGYSINQSMLSSHFHLLFCKRKSI